MCVWNTFIWGRARYNDVRDFLSATNDDIFCCKVYPELVILTVEIKSHTLNMHDVEWRICALVHIVWDLRVPVNVSYNIS